jgi:hypothetical protein
MQCSGASAVEWSEWLGSDLVVERQSPAGKEVSMETEDIVWIRHQVTTAEDTEDWKDWKDWID